LEAIMSDESSGGREIPLQVTGMTCMMCVKHVTRALEKVPGISRVEVTLTPPRAVIRYDPAKVSPDAMIETVRAAGYDAHV
jgi:copper chaperone CopZ